MGESAFPSPGVALGMSQQGAYEGMSLRDYVAIRMLGVAILHNDADTAAIMAFEWADAFLKARQA